MTPPVELAGKLLARTRSSFVEEARTAALMLCELIRKHGLSIVDPSQTPPRRQVEDRPAYRVITSRFASRCTECGTRIHEGDRCAWCKGLGVLCLECWEDR